MADETQADAKASLAAIDAAEVKRAEWLGKGWELHWGPDPDGKAFAVSLTKLGRVTGARATGDDLAVAIERCEGVVVPLSELLQGN